MQSTLMEPPSIATAQLLLQLNNVKLGYGSRAVLNDVSFTLHAGDYVAIVGSNGSGKSTLIKSLIGLLKPQSGQVQRSGNLHFGYVPQLQTVDEMFPLAVSDVVLMGRYGRIGALRRPSSSDRDRVQTALEEVGIGHLGQRLYRELSGGQKQRTLIARALVGEPQVLVLDEHTNDLDLVAEKAIMALIDRLHAEHQIAVVMVSHSLNTVANHAHTIGLLREGRCSFAAVETVMQTEYLQDFYSAPLQVLDVDGRRVVI
jgi:ABC-type Mn2+/Zn2+ transport system ATPase subunit